MSSISVLAHLKKATDGKSISGKKFLEYEPYWQLFGFVSFFFLKNILRNFDHSNLQHFFILK